MTAFDIEVDKASSLPLYSQVARQLERAISDGLLGPGDRLENEISLAQTLGLSRPTVRRAIQELVDSGLLVRKRGVGTQVVTGSINRPAALSSLYEDMLGNGQAPSTVVLSNSVVPASDEVAQRLDLPPRTPVIRLHRLRLSHGAPLAILENYLPETVGAPSDLELREGGLYTLLGAAGVRIRVARQRIGAEQGTSWECRLLAEPTGSVLLTVDRLAFDDFGRPVEWGRHVYRSSLYDISVTLTRI